MTDKKSLLIELGTEELPPTALDALSEAFLRGICDGLDKRGIAADTAHARRGCSPRRLIAHVPEVAATQPDQSVERRGPAVTAGRDAEGQPTRALQGFARSCGVGVDALETIETDKGAWFVYRAVKPGQSLEALMPELVDEALKALPIPRPMRWGDHDARFVRPVHWLVMLHGADILQGQVLGLASGRQSRGHRFHHPGPVHLADADAWTDALRAAHVLADPQERRQRVRDDVQRVATEVGGTPQLSDALLDEIANLNEWPVAIGCAFERDFLAVPPEALISTMETHQKFVPLLDADGHLSERFIGVANIDSTDPDQIRKGYERVIRPRFADARFFWDEDLKTPLAGYQNWLKNVTYQTSLGSQWDKCVRVAELSRVIANRVGVDAGLATHAAALSKCDLMTRMVGEFPELQGVMGRYYARAHNEPEAVALALDSFYQPRFAGDAIAADPVGRVLAVAERLDTLAGIFAVGLKPSGNKDPFALRRAALGLARTLIEADMGIDLKAAFQESLELIPETALRAGVKPRKGKEPVAPDPGKRRAVLAAELYAFVLERLRGYYLDQGLSAECFEAVLAVSPAVLPDFDRRLRAVYAFSQRPQAANLAAANKRVGNLLRKQAETAPVVQSQSVDASQLQAPAEKDLAAALTAVREDCLQQVANGDYGSALAHLATLQAPVDRFFDEVMVMTDDAELRTRRLALLRELRQSFLAIADIARLQEA